MFYYSLDNDQLYISRKLNETLKLNDKNSVFKLKFLRNILSVNQRIRLFKNVKCSLLKNKNTDLFLQINTPPPQKNLRFQ